MILSDYRKTHICNFDLTKYTFTVKHATKMPIGFLQPHIGFILKGSGEFISDTSTLQVSCGDIIFIPRARKYESHWQGSPDIEFYSLDFDTNDFNHNAYDFQAISGNSFGFLFHELYSTVAKDKDFKAISIFYGLLHELSIVLNKTEIHHSDLLLPAMKFIENNYLSDFCISELAKMSNLSESRFYYLFKKSTGYSPIDYKNSIRIKYAVSYILKHNYSVETICEKLNFCSCAYFRRILKKFTGKTPTEIRNEYGIL